MRNRKRPADQEEEREREEKAAALPLEGLPGRSWFLALVRPSCVPAHGLGGYLVALRNQLIK